MSIIADQDNDMSTNDAIVANCHESNKELQDGSWKKSPSTSGTSQQKSSFPETTFNSMICSHSVKLQSNQDRLSPIARRRDAFEILMSTSSNGKSTGSRAKESKGKSRHNRNSVNHRFHPRIHFVECPAGCGIRLLDKEVNDHLDRKCIILNKGDNYIDLYKSDISSPILVQDEHDSSPDDCPKKSRKWEVQDEILDEYKSTPDKVKRLCFDSQDQVFEEEVKTSKCDHSYMSVVGITAIDLPDVSTKSLSSAAISLIDDSNMTCVVDHKNDSGIEKHMNVQGDTSTNDIAHEPFGTNTIIAETRAVYASTEKVMNRLKNAAEDDSALSLPSMETCRPNDSSVAAAFQNGCHFEQSCVDCEAATQVTCFAAIDDTVSPARVSNKVISPSPGMMNIASSSEDVLSTASRLEGNVSPPNNPNQSCNFDNYEKTISKNTAEPSKVNAFTRMMEAASKESVNKSNSNKHGVLSPLVAKHRLHLNEDFSVSLFTNNLNGSTTLNGENVETQPATIVWVSTVNVKLTNDDLKIGNDDMAQGCRKIELTVSSSIPSHRNCADERLIDNRNKSSQWVNQARSTQLVRRHSKLSPSALISILQKSIRRRRPLPSVRVAMELIDRSMEAFLRRLPVIILEDSTLHPHYGSIVWLMVAHSKDYVLSPIMISRLLQIVYEVASCPWTDPCDVTDTTISDYDGTLQLDTSRQSCVFPSSRPSTLSDFVNFNVQSNSSICWVYCILLRREYGGLKHDVEMLQTYASIWHRRLHLETLNDIRLHNFISSPQSEALQTNSDAELTKNVFNEWSSLPWTIHESGMKNSVQRVPHLVIDHLTLEDICFEGIDFHCSTILEFVLLDENYCEICLDVLRLAIIGHTSTTNGTESVACNKLMAPIPDSIKEGHPWLTSLLKQSIWNFSSKVNHRLPLQCFFKHNFAANGKAPTALASNDTSNQSNDNNCTLNTNKSTIDQLSYFIWHYAFAKKVKEFQTKYIQERLFVASKF